MEQWREWWNTSRRGAGFIDARMMWKCMRRLARVLSRQVATERGGYLPGHWAEVWGRWHAGPFWSGALQYSLTPYYTSMAINDLRWEIYQRKVEAARQPLA